MTIQGAIAELQNLLNADDVPMYYKGGIEKVIETIAMEFDKDRPSNSEIPNNCELQTIRCPKCGRTDYIRDMEKDMGIKGSHYKYKCINCNTYIKDEPTISKMEQVDKDINIRSKDCETCKWGEWYRKGYDITMMSDECGGCCSWNSKWTPKDEPQTDTEIAKAIVHKMIDDSVIAEDAYPDLRQKLHDAVDEYEPQTDFLTFLYNVINPNEMEEYRAMYEAKGIATKDEPQTDSAWK